MEMIQGFLSSVVYFVILIGVLIFVHEAGHFFFAKLFKVKVHVFSLGFGKQLIGFKRGETLYKVSLVPIGGYVKMLGEDPSEEIGSDERGRAFTDKPAWQRLIIILAGPVMNIIFPLFLHFFVGLTINEVVPAELGLVLPDSPAWRAGIQPGDTVKSVNGEPVQSFRDLVELVSPNAGKKIQVVLRRGDELLETTVIPEATVETIILDEKETVGRIGVGAEYLPPMVGLDDPSSVGARAGLKTFDLVVSVNGKPITRLIDLEKELRAAAGSQITLQVRSLKKDAAPPFRPLENQLESTTKQLGIQVPEGMKTLADLGISSSIDFIAYVTPGGAAEKSGLRYGDHLVGLDGSPYNTGRIYGALDENPNAERTIAWIRDGVRQEGTYKQKFIPAGEAGDLGIKQDAYDKGFWGLMGTTVAPQKIPNPALVRNAFRHAVGETWSGIRLIGIGFKLLFQGRVSMRSIGGPLMIGQLAGQAGQMGLDSFFWMMALISLNLGLLNLLPIPVLDGGQVVLIGIESITRRPISNTIKEKVMLVGVAMLVLLMIFATWNDISRLIIG